MSSGRCRLNLEGIREWIRYLIQIILRRQRIVLYTVGSHL